MLQAGSSSLCNIYYYTESGPLYTRVAVLVLGYSWGWMSIASVFKTNRFSHNRAWASFAAALDWLWMQGGAAGREVPFTEKTDSSRAPKLDLKLSDHELFLKHCVHESGGLKATDMWEDAA